jgi:aerobic carbon-monoxide dehydrogenase medium subunit
MKPAPFDYFVPKSLEEALVLLAEHGEDAQILAGGQSLVPLIALRMASPAILIDINRIAELRLLEETGEALHVGACVRHSELLRHTAARPSWKLIADALGEVAHPGIRNRGTPCGSLALADPAAEAPAYAVALGADIVLASMRGERIVPADEFFLGIYETARKPDEMIVAASFPLPDAGWRFGFQEIARRRGDYAIAGLCAGLRVEEGRIVEARLVFFGVTDRPMRALQVEGMLAGGDPEDGNLREGVAAMAMSEIEVAGNAEYGPAYKRHLVGVLTGRVLGQLANGRGGQ